MTRCNHIFTRVDWARMIFAATLILLLPIECCSQVLPQWGKLKKGSYEVGYLDTVIFKADEKFSYYSYQGNKPFFIGVWYPSSSDSKVAYMHYKDYFNFQSKKEYAVILDSLKKAFHDVLIESGILIDITTQDSIVHVPMGRVQRSLYEDVLNTRVSAKYHLPKLVKKFPCILYHHGAQSALFDNNVFCEYMASHGFVVISSSFNLPDQSGVDLLISSTDKRFGYLTDFRFVIDFAKKQPWVDTTSMVAVGHSLGAQIAMMNDNQEGIKSFQRIIALHTTLEPRTVSEARKFWPKFNYLFDNQAYLSTTPTFILAPTFLMYRSGLDTLTKRRVIQKITGYPGYKPFRNNDITPYTFITVKHGIEHNGFIAVGNSRFPFISKYNLSDSEAIMKQQEIYESIVKLTADLISTFKKVSNNNEGMGYSKYFLFETIN